MFKNRIPFLVGTLILMVASCGISPTGQTGGVSGTNSNFTLVGSVSTTEFIRSIAIDGEYLYAAAGYDGINIYVISNNTNLIKLTNITVNNFSVNDVTIKTVTSTSIKYLFAVLGKYSGNGGFVAYDLSAGAAIPVPTNVNNAVGGASGNAIIALDSGHVYVADETKGLYYYAFTTIDNYAGPASVAGLTFGAIDMDVVDTTFFVAAKDNGVNIINTAGTHLANISFPLSYAQSVDADANILAVGDKFGGAMFFDISTISSPKYKGSYATTGGCYDIVVSGSDVYVADGNNGILWLNITTVTSPALKGFIKPSGTAFKLVVPAGTGGYVYAAYGNDGIKVFKKQN